MTESTTGTEIQDAQVFTVSDTGHRWTKVFCMAVLLSLPSTMKADERRGDRGGSSAHGEPSDRATTEDHARDDSSGIVDVVALHDRRIKESSGLAVSQRRFGRLWTHNDSGDKPRLFALDRQGRVTGEVTLDVDSATDWEDMASFLLDDQAMLLIGDCGDNDANRDAIELHLFNEPDPDTDSRIESSMLKSLRVTFEDGPRDCEAIAVDRERQVILLITKSKLPLAGIYQLPLKGPWNSGVASTQRVHSVVARRIGTLPLSLATAMDIDDTNGDVWVTNYFQAFCFRCTDRTLPIQQQLQQLPKPQELPRWRQIEAIAVDSGLQLWVTSEGSPAPLGRIPIK